MLFALALGALGGCAAVPPAAAPAGAAVDTRACGLSPAAHHADWRRFRGAYPYHIQGVALSDASPEGVRTLILAEPPPGVTFKDIKEAAPGLLVKPHACYHRVGYDGWTRDVVATLPRLDEAQLAEVVGGFQRLLFQTAYKAYVLGIPSAPPARRESDVLDLQVTAAELQQWVFDASERFSPIDGGPEAPLETLVQRGEPGVYLSDSPGLVAWVIPRDRPFEDSAVEARQFALESDILVGAAASGQALVVLGRERSVGVDVLPPLRTETLAMLAAVKQTELGQSYERNSFLAGRFDGKRDWAPIYLSPELIDTEYGSLLNITDQLLKSWSNNGLTRYDNFDYPDPPRWPFPAPLASHVGAQSLTFNWNTYGMGAALDFGSHELITFRSTGALPVTYIAPEKPTDTYEDEAYGYFREMNDPNLVRVAQYAAFYQLFRRFEVPTRAPAPRVASDAQRRVLKEETLKLLKGLRDASNDELLEATKRGFAELTAAEPEERRIRIQRGAAAMLANMASRLRTLGAGSGDAALDQLASDIALPREAGEEVGVILTRALAPELGDKPELIGQLLRRITDLDAVKNRYVKAATLRKGTWIHTPTAVVSWNEVPLNDAVGGHNLDARVARFRFSPHVAPDHVEVIQEGASKVAVLNPFDLGKVSEVLRTGGKGAAPPPARSRQVALALPEGPRAPSSRGFTLDDTTAVHKRQLGGWRATGERPSAAQSELVDLFSGDDAPAAVVTRRGGALDVAIRGRRSSYQVSSLSDVTDLLRSAAKARGGKEPMIIHIERMSPDEAHALVKTIPLREKASRRAVTVHVEEGSAKRLGEVFREECDLSRAKIGEPRVVRLQGGAQRIAIDVDIPVARPARGSLTVRIRMLFGRLTESTKLLVERLRRVVSRERSAAPATFEQLTRDFHRELQRIDPDGKVEVWVDEMKHDGVVLEDRGDGAQGTARQPG
ncbi:hypothetical protein [Sorangium cellulosum]|uniref:hypothetical protein n=1 Tax=Sorangium cellulosum TaxID=56 RepID=UPI000CF40243|nr:hypothetical protein [Sorangium cellulosum]